MGFSSKPKMIIGVNADTIVKVNTKTETFEKYDERGNKTGKTGTDTKITLTATVNGVEKSKNGEKIWCETISELLEIFDEPNLNKFGVINTIYDGEYTVEDTIIGIPIATVDVMENETSEVDPETFNNAWEAVKVICKEKFGVDVEPKIFLYANASY